MNVFNKWFAKKCREAWENAQESVKGQGPCTPVHNSDLIDSNGIRFAVYKADGGHVVETSTRDRNHDRQTNLYIVTSEQDLGERLAHIVTYEAIKR